MSIAPIQTRFDGGEVSQRLSGRFDSELYKKALKQAKNFEPLAQGSLRMRSGSFFSNRLNTADARVRTIRIRTSSGTDYLAVLFNKKMNLYAISGDQVVVPGGGGTPEPVNTQELVTNGDFSKAGGAGWSSRNFGPPQFVGVFFDDPTIIDPTTNAPSQLGYARIVKSNAAYPVMYQKITSIGEAYCDISFLACIDVLRPMRIKISTQDPAAWADQGGGGDMMSVQLVSGTNNVFIPAPDPGHNPISPGEFGAQDLGQFANPNGVIGGLHLPAGDYYLSFQVDAGGGNLSNLYVDNVSVKATYVGGGGGGGNPGGLDIPTPWTLDEVASIQYDTETGRDRTIFVHPSHNPWGLTFVAQGNWTFGDIAFVSTPAGWAGANWPACVQVHAGRIYYAGEPKAKNRVLGSKSRDPDNFTIGVNPGDALDFNIATKGAIRWLSSYRTLLAGSDLGHFTIFGSTGVPLVGDIQVREESGYQAAPIQAVKSGEHALFVTSDLRRVRATAFDFQSNGWGAKDLVFAAEHITAGLIKEIYHVWTPDSMTILLLQDGTLAICTFEPSEAVLAWWTVNIGAFICSAAPVQGPSGAFLWMAVLRNGAVCLERLSLSEGADELSYVDSHRKVVAAAYVYPNGDPGVTLDGFTHLAGLAVYVMWNGIVVPANVIGLGDPDIGKIRLKDAQTGGVSIAGQTVTVGMNYKATAITMPKDSKTGKAKSSKIGVIVNNSRLPKINGKRPPDRDPTTAADTVVAAVTGKRTVVNLGWSDGDEITIEQDLPFRTEVCALYSITEVTS